MNFSVFSTIRERYIVMMMLSLLILSCSSGGGDDVELPAPMIDNEAPSTPTGLASSNITQTSVVLTWNASTDNVGVRDYSIHQNDVNIATTRNLSFTIENLDPDTLYQYRVLATDNSGNSSELSSAISITTLEEIIPELQTASGDIEVYIGSLIDAVPGSSGNNYKIPTTNELNIWNTVIDAILANNIPEAVIQSAGINYQITEFTDITNSSNNVFYILEERSNKQNHWGIYVFNNNSLRDNLILTAPHILNDTNTGRQTVFCFKNNLARAVFINSAHRCNNNTSSSCSGTTSTCGTNEAFRVSDLAHNTNSAFQRTIENLFNNITNSVFVQLHGFGKRDSDPYVIMSNGTRETPNIDYAAQIRDALFAEDNVLTFRIAHIDTDWNRLIGFTNTQGRLINGSVSPCDVSAVNTTGRFIHIEQERSRLRENASVWIKMSNALGNVFQ
ncbi:hypothetical protein GTQ40_17265 [Flavobacteriaceae bacterium R38]|nr:hypothetical protein [Flavobacteriaceae bacterium R38]